MNDIKLVINYNALKIAACLPQNQSCSYAIDVRRRERENNKSIYQWTRRPTKNESEWNFLRHVAVDSEQNIPPLLDYTLVRSKHIKSGRSNLQRSVLKEFSLCKYTLLLVKD